MRKVLIAILIMIVAFTIVNDAGRYVMTWFKLDEGTRAAASAAGRLNGSLDENGNAAVEAAGKRDVTVYGYDEHEQTIYVWTEKELEGTWILGPVLGVTQSSGTYGDPYIMRSEGSAPKS